MDTLNIDTKSQLAKLIATENITVQQNNVKTASFDVVNRVLTLPIFKTDSKDVTDMLVAHECAHALFTPTNGWKKIADDNELRSYVNVLEDCRIDKKIQKRYPGVVRNYITGFDIFEKLNFFNIKDKDINKDLMLIDKVNLYYKSSKRLPFNFSTKDNKWLIKIDALKSFADVVRLAKEMLDWQKKQIEQMKKLPDFDSHTITENYNLNDDAETEEGEKPENSDEDSSEDKENKKEDGEDLKSKDNGEDKKDSKKDVQAINPEAQKGGGSGISPDKLIAITNESLEQNKKRLYEKDSKNYSYYNLPNPILSNVVISNKQYLLDQRKYIREQLLSSNAYSAEHRKYYNWLVREYKKFKNVNKKTVMYLVKEFEMKKSATAYKRATTDKTGVIDPLKLKSYKFSEDIFKRLTILPDAKNHGMIMLLDWSGSMCDTLQQTIEQLMNLVWFCDKVNIPYEVYLFTSEYKDPDNSISGLRAWKRSKAPGRGSTSFKYKNGEIQQLEYLAERLDGQITYLTTYDNTGATSKKS